jgi:cell division septal protein FtsQ
MYVWIWRHLPGPAAVKLMQALFLVAAVALLLLFVVFPWVEPHLPINQVTVPGNK